MKHSMSNRARNCCPRTQASQGRAISAFKKKVEAVQLRLILKVTPRTCPNETLKISKGTGFDVCFPRNAP